MSELIMVMGNDCLDYINKPIGFGSHDDFTYGNMPIGNLLSHNVVRVVGRQSDHSMHFDPNYLSTSLQKWNHNTNKRKIGLVLGDSPDGGLEVAILGDEDIAFSSNGHMQFISNRLYYARDYHYDSPLLPTDEYVLSTQKVGGYPSYPGACKVIPNNDVTGYVPFDDAIDYRPTFDAYLSGSAFGCIWEYAHQLTSGGTYTLTNDKDNTMVFGVILDLQEEYYYCDVCRDNPLATISGNLYNALGRIFFDGEGVIPQRIPLGTQFDMLKFPAWCSEPITRTNLTAIPFNLILTRSEQEAKNYLNNGTLPTDAFMYPLDWNNLPTYDDPVPTADTPEDYPDDNDPDDDIRDFDPMPPEEPTYTANQLTNYNWYWLTVPEWAGFINWFWHDIGDYNDFDDIIAKVKGLYNDLASSVIMCRYYPVDVSWIGGTGTQKNIKLGMIEKNGAVDTLANTSLRVQDIGHVHVPNKYKSFMDMSPYSQLSLYLPWHGYLDIDVNLFSGHDLYVKALYDYLSGTIQYYVYYDNEVLVNTILCKMAMDIPITLQTKNDRDSAIFSNVSSTIGGLVGAGVGIASGNPIGMVMGVTQGIGAMNSGNVSAPMRLMGNVGESGAYLGCQYCTLIIRRPTIQPSDGNSQTAVKKGLTTWKHNVGMLCGYGYTLSSLEGKGFTTCHTPRIDFKNSVPLQTEVDEIYDYLQKGVIL